MKLQGITPILRIFDEEKAKSFYVDYLGFKIDWEHRFEEQLPVYMQLSKDEIRLHVSEHYGDCSPGAAIRIEIAGLEAYHRGLIEKKNKYSRPGLERMPWGSDECVVIDPFGNRIIFYENHSEAER